MRVYTLSDMRSEKKLRVYTASEAKGLRQWTLWLKCLYASKLQQKPTGLNGEHAFRIFVFIWGEQITWHWSSNVYNVLLMFLENDNMSDEITITGSLVQLPSQTEVKFGTIILSGYFTGYWQNRETANIGLVSSVGRAPGSSIRRSQVQILL